MTYGALYKQLRNIGTRINILEIDYPDMGKSIKDSHPYIEIKGPYYYWIVRERGNILNKKRFINVDNLYYEVFKHITFDMAIKYEMGHRTDGYDPRRIIFSYQIKLMEKLRHSWKERIKQDINNILSENPYIDSSST